MLHPSLAKFTDKAPEGCTGSRARTALGSCAFCPTKTSSLDGIGHRAILSRMGRPTTGVYEVSAPDGEVLGVARASSAGQALRRVNELCGVPCTVLGRRVFFAEQHRHACAGRWQVRSVRLSVKAATLLTRNYVPDGPTAVFVAPSPRRPNPGLLPGLRARARTSCDRHIHPPIPG